jgi:hypothetical protein
MRGRRMVVHKYPFMVPNAQSYRQYISACADIRYVRFHAHS